MPIREPGFVTNLLFGHFRIGLMPSSGWPMQNKLNGIFIDFCSLLTLAVLFSFFILFYCYFVCVCVYACALSFFCFYLCLERESHTMAWVVEKTSLWEEWSQGDVIRRYCMKNIFQLKKEIFFVYVGQEDFRNWALKIKVSHGSLP